MGKIKGKPQKETQEFAYEIVDPKFGKMSVRNTANAWWHEKRKVEDLIEAKKIGANDNMCCYYAGITKHQYDYFVKVHPDFSEFFTYLKDNPKVKALKTIYNDLRNPETAKWYLERKLKEEYSSRQEHTGAGGKDLFEVTDEQARKMAINTLAAIEERKKARATLRKKNDDDAKD